MGQLPIDASLCRNPDACLFFLVSQLKTPKPSTLNPRTCAHPGSKLCQANHYVAHQYECKSLRQFVFRVWGMVFKGSMCSLGFGVRGVKLDGGGGLGLWE